jgi:hypothetical protein
MQVQRVCHDTLPWLISFSLDAMKVIVMWLSLALLLFCYIAGFGILLSRLLPAGRISATGIAVLLAVFCAVIVMSVYCAVSSWLIIWRRLASRREIYSIASAGRLSCFDHWLIRTLGPKA